MSNVVFSSIALFAVFTGIAVYNAAAAFLEHAWRRFWVALGASVPLAAVTLGAIWIGLQYPTANFWANQGFGADWECSNLGKGSAQVCARDLPARLQTKPAQRDSNPN